ncbi:acyl-CoA dehydrogenase family protein [Rhodobacter sp. 24-YEA-8]|uniref:acyl-CoA dehydrogenase family protein n=1 Tax=Rhodobacter sp. 24-YEA-8 TaxID=1884310 RepID=UPI0008989F4B|nr:acyl-CoA dehydrogenase family protein [Rhodobacter sp. 24-YEA-8]SED88282.1 Acyl-CoA dehydrogenase [Rhodobacter sp. 24-YEA-8]
MTAAQNFNTRPRWSEPAFTSLLARIAEEAPARDRDRDLPHEPVLALRRAGFGLLRLPVSAGGLGLSLRETLSRVIRLAEADANIAHIFRTHYVFVETYARSPIGPAETRLRDAILGGALVGFGSGELGMVVRTRDFATTATPDGSGFRLSGQKFYSTGTLYADLVMVRLRTADGDEGVAVLPTDRPGIRRIDDWDGMGQRLTGSGTTLLDNVRVEADEILLHKTRPEAAQAYPTTIAQLYLTAAVAGILAAIAADAARLLVTRGRSFTHASADLPREDPLLLASLGQLSALAFSAEATVLAAADALDSATDSTDEAGLRDRALAHAAALAAAQAKIVVDEDAARAGSLIFEVGGASATREGVNLGRHWRNARTLATHNPGLYKARAIGSHLIDGTPLPENGFF